MGPSGPILLSAVLFLSANASAALEDFLSEDAVLVWGGFVKSNANGGDVGNGDDFGDELPFGTFDGDMPLPLTKLLSLIGEVGNGDDDDGFDGELPFGALDGNLPFPLTALLSLTGLRPHLVFPLLCDAIMDQEFMSVSLKSSSVGILEESRPVCSGLMEP